MGILKDTLLNYCYESTQGLRIEVKPDEWDRVDEESDYCSCVYENTGFQGMIFPLKDIFNYVTWKNPLYSFRHRMGYKKIRDMDPYEKLDLLTDYQNNSRWDCSPFGCGSDESWEGKVVDINGIPFYMTFYYIGS